MSTDNSTQDNEPIKGKFLDKISNKLALPIGIIGLLSGGFFFIYSNFINVPITNLEFNIITNTSLIDIKEEINKLNIYYDTINFIKEDKNISFTIVEVKNTGNKTIATNDYDLNIPFGITLTNAELIKSPELTQSSDEKYFKDVIKSSSPNKIILNKKIIDPDEFFQMKFYTMHNNGVRPTFKNMGKISGQKEIKIIEKGSAEADDIENFKEDYLKLKKEANLTQLISLLSIALITILSLLTLTLYKNNNIRTRTNNMLYKKNEDLIIAKEKAQLELKKIKTKIKKS